MKNLEFASEKELEKMLSMSIGRAFRMASEGNDTEAMKAKADAKKINQQLQDMKS